MQGIKENKTRSEQVRQVNNTLITILLTVTQCLLKSSLIISTYLFIIWLLFADAQAQDNLPTLTNSKTLLNYNTAYTLDDKRLSLSRFTLEWSTRMHLGANWNAHFELFAELADDDVGLGGSDNFAHFSQALIDNKYARLGFSQFLLTWRKGKNTVDLGKQVVPWGLLDGVQVSDRFDPVRRRDFVFAQVKPERLARWGVRWRTRLSSWQVDSALVFDGTVSQQATLGSEFQLTAPRYVAGLELSQLGNDISLKLKSDERNHTLSQSTLGMRLSRHLGAGEFSLLGFRGPDTEPVLSLSTPTNQLLTINLHYPRRNVIALNYDFSEGSAVWRLEAAYIPDQTFNIKSSQGMLLSQGARSLFGMGLDWQTSKQLFINAQIVVDYIDLPKNQLFRPKTDSILTLRIQRPFFNQRLLLKTELIASLNQHDGVLRPGFSYELSDNSKLNGGLDWAFGDLDGQFGQFKNASRLWLGLSYAF
jgi:hypothetical protein